MNDTEQKIILFYYLLYNIETLFIWKTYVIKLTEIMLKRCLKTLHKSHQTLTVEKQLIFLKILTYFHQNKKKRKL